MLRKRVSSVDELRAWLSGLEADNAYVRIREIETDLEIIGGLHLKYSNPTIKKPEDME